MRLTSLCRRALRWVGRLMPTGLPPIAICWVRPADACINKVTCCECVSACEVQPTFIYIYIVRSLPDAEREPWSSKSTMSLRNCDKLTALRCYISKMKESRESVEDTAAFGRKSAARIPSVSPKISNFSKTHGPILTFTKSHVTNFSILSNISTNISPAKSIITMYV